jgi:hypothetical protein
MMDGDGEWPTSEDVARHLRISVRTIHDWRQMQSGEQWPTKLAGGPRDGAELRL